MKTYLFQTTCGRFGCLQPDSEFCLFTLQISPGFEPLENSYLQHESLAAIAKTLSKDVSHVTPADQVNYFFKRYHFSGTNPNWNGENMITKEAGEFFPRMNRDSPGLFKHFLLEGNVVDEVRAYYNIYESMEAIFKIIEPTARNLATYGHRIREILIIACTEVEFLLKRSLLDNGYKAGSLSTRDYVKLLPWLCFDQYSVNLKMHPELGDFSPFKNWHRDEPTKSIEWYDAYNAVKHNRGDDFARASIKSMIESVAALHILLEAMYGSEIFKSSKSEFKSCFYTSKKPAWSIPEIDIPIFKTNGERIWNSRKALFSMHT